MIYVQTGRGRKMSKKKERYVDKKWILVAVLLATTILAVGFAGCAEQQAPSEKAPTVPKPSAHPNYPERPITFIVGYGAGGGTDRFARAMAASMEPILGEKIVIINLPGAAASIAEDYLLKQPADGYYVLAMGSDFPINLVTGRNPHDLKDYYPLCRVQQDIGTIQINAHDPRFSNLDEFIEYAKNNKVIIGGGGAGGIDEVLVTRFAKAAGIKYEYVSYDKTENMRAALLGRHIDAMFEEIGPSIGLIESGDIKPIVIFAEKRIEGFEDVPTAREYGWDITQGRWRGFMLKAGVPEDIAEYLEKVAYAAYQTPEYKEFEKNSYLHLREGWLGHEDFAELIKKEIRDYAEILKELGYIEEPQEVV